jgi:protein regulator of cytokinesis 1
MTEEAQNIIKTIKQMEASLDDDKDRGYDLDSQGLRVTYPLIDCLRELKEKYNIVGRLHRERFEQVKKLVQALESYSSHLESSFVKIRLPPTSANACPPNFDLSPSYVATLDEEFSRVYDEYNKRVVTVQQIAEEIVRLWSELGIPQAQTDSLIVQHYRDAPEQLGLHQADLDRLRSRRDKLLDEKKGRERRLNEMKKNIENLWDRLGIEEADRRAFLAANRGCGMRTINEFEDELARLNELKRQNLHLFVEDARVRLQQLWDSLFFAEEEMLDFTPAFSDVYSDALLSAHEAEIERLTTLKEQRAPILATVEKYRSLIADREALAASANDASRLLLKPQKGEKRDPGKLLREEKMRKRIAKELPKVSAELTKVLLKYEDEFGRPFLIHGDRFLDEIEEAETRAPPPRSKTPNGLPPRAKTPAPAPTTKPAASAPKSAPSRPASVMKGAPPRSTAKTPTGNRPGTVRQPAAPTSMQAKSPSKIPSRVPLGNLKHGNNSPERRAAPVPPTSHVGHEEPPNHPPSTRTMGPPRAPPPKMRDVRDVFVPSGAEQTSASTHGRAAPATNRPTSTVSSSSSSEGGRYVRPQSPEDVYDDRERMSYMSASLLSRDRQQEQLDPYRSRVQPAHSSSTSNHGHHHHHHPPPTVSAAASRQTSNTSSNLTTGTTASGSENWETYSDASELEPERDARETYYHKVQQSLSATTDVVGVGVRSVDHGPMAPPPAKPRPQQYGQRQYRPQYRELSDENVDDRVRVEGSDAAWSTELEETY